MLPIGSSFQSCRQLQEVKLMEMRERNSPEIWASMVSFGKVRPGWAVLPWVGRRKEEVSMGMVKGEII